MPADVSEGEAAAAEVVCQTFMIQTDQLEDRRVQVVDAHPIPDSLHSQFIRGTVDETFFDPRRWPATPLWSQAGDADQADP